MLKSRNTFEKHHILHLVHNWKYWSISTKTTNSAWSWDWRENHQRPTTEKGQDKIRSAKEEKSIVLYSEINVKMYPERFSAYVLESYHHEDKREGNQDISHCECRYTGRDQESEANSCQADQRHGQGKAEEGHKIWLQSWKQTRAGKQAGSATNQPEF